MFIETIDYTLLEEAIGQILIAASKAGIVLVEFWSEEENKAADFLKEAFPMAEIRCDGPLVAEGKLQLEEYFAGQRQCFTCTLAPIGTDFQKKVWQQLQEIPFGKTQSYGEISKKVLGSPKGARAVGQANSRNPIAIIIPCHRVINSGGSLGGFAGGLDVKRWLLKWEQTTNGDNGK